jgi:hypothetical protein
MTFCGPARDTVLTKGNLSLNVEALTKQNGVRLLGKFEKKFKKKLKPTYPT